MLLGFLSFLLIGGEGLISAICVSESMGSTWHPCSKKREEELTTESVTEKGKFTGSFWRRWVQLTNARKRHD
ncbi:hypothetical protein RHGRI_005681 [Rhododendron griersonianum]|uniref:Secreted protein n=1 Tax=Rhododendron griersonianum TaxID=479676 RepID=A0AAV6LEE6_9ERIC|nr:hypothetical protein RHGRI_005681 [Rhododendron griersonianum]